MNDRKREKMMKIFRVCALIIAVVMIISVIAQSFVY